MNIALESAFDRLLSKYERTFGEPPPFTSASADEVVTHMRRRLRDAFSADARRGWGGTPGAAAGQ